MHASTFHALLIGIDHYLPNKLPDGGSYPSLGGCVRDVASMEEFLRQKLEIPGERIMKLAMPVAGIENPPEPNAQWPTYENIVKAFSDLTDDAAPGDQVYIHYCGHGGRVPTRFPDLKGASGLDETLVPMDVGNAEARHLRDVELAYLLKKMPLPCGSPLKEPT